MTEDIDQLRMDLITMTGIFLFFYMFICGYIIVLTESKNGYNGDNNFQRFIRSDCYCFMIIITISDFPIVVLTWLIWMASKLERWVTNQLHICWWIDKLYRINPLGRWGWILSCCKNSQDLIVLLVLNELSRQSTWSWS